MDNKKIKKDNGRRQYKQINVCFDIYARFFTMNNTIKCSSQVRSRLITAIVAILIFVVSFVIGAVSIIRIGNTTLDGNVTEVTGVLTKYDKEENDFVIRINDVDGTYNASPLINALKDKLGSDVAAEEYAENLAGKLITFYIPQHPSSTNNVWILGLKVDEDIAIDYTTLIPKLQQTNKTTTTALVVCAVVFAVVACALIIAYTRQSPQKTYVLSEKFAEFLANQQPTYANKNKTMPVILIVEGVVFLLSVLACVICENFVSEKVSDIMYTVSGIYMLAVVASAIVMYVILKNKTRQMYKDNYPFDSTDFCLLPVGKKMKKEFIEHMKAFRATNPDLFTDGGNLYDLLFTDHGVEVYSIDEENESEDFDQDDEQPFFDNKNSDEEYHAKNITYGRTPELTLTYDQLNFEALPYFNVANKPIVVVIKSRLDPNTVSLPDDFQNDIHLHLDGDLLSTLSTYNVRVERLELILGDLPTLLDQTAHTRMKFTKIPDEKEKNN